MTKKVYELNTVYELNVAVEVGSGLALAGYCFFEAEDEQEAREKAVAYFDAIRGRWRHMLPAARSGYPVETAPR